MADFETVQRGAETLSGVGEINTGPNGQINLDHLLQLLTHYRTASTAKLQGKE